MAAGKDTKAQASPHRAEGPSQVAQAKDSPGIWVDILVHFSSPGSYLWWPGMVSFLEEVAACLEAILTSSLNPLQSDALDANHALSTVLGCSRGVRTGAFLVHVPHRGQVGFVGASRSLPTVSLPTSQSLVHPLIWSGWLFGPQLQAPFFPFLGFTMLF